MNEIIYILISAYRKLPVYYTDDLEEARRVMWEYAHYYDDAPQDIRGDNRGVWHSNAGGTSTAYIYIYHHSAQDYLDHAMQIAKLNKDKR